MAGFFSISGQTGQWKSIPTTKEEPCWSGEYSPVQTEHLDTYYVYDDLNRLRYVLPPQAEEIFRQAGETRSGSDKGIADYAYAPCYNGNISSISWKAGEEQTTRGYRFTYDGLDRMKKAEYGEGERLASLANSSSKTGQTGKRNAPAMKITMILFRSK